MQDYPSQIDCAWLAVDALGRLAAMITAGCGPIPERALSGGADVTDIEGMILDLPAIYDAKMHVQVPRPEGYAAFAKRGLFTYDWTDLHRTSVCKIDAYELVASPSTSLLKRALPAPLQAVAIAFDPWITFGAPKLRVG